MARRAAQQYDDEPEDDDRDAPQAADLTDDDDEQITIPCPRCGREVWEFAERCSKCGVWITSAQSDAAPTSRRQMYLIGVIALAMIVAGWIMWKLKAFHWALRG